MTGDTPDVDLAAEPLSAEEEAAAGWALIDRRFIRWHDRTCGTHTFKANRPECDCGLQDTLDRERARLDHDSLDAAWAEAEAALTPTRNITLTHSAPRLSYSAWSQDSATPVVMSEDGEYVQDEPGTVFGHGPTPEAALRSLIRALSALSDRSPSDG